MKNELIAQITKIDDFLTPFELNSSEEILFTLIQLIDIRDDREVSDNTMNRLFSKVNQKQFLLLGMDELIEGYFVHIGTFIGGFMQFFFQKMEEHPEKIGESMEELIEILGANISKEEIASLYYELKTKLQFIQENSVLSAEPMVGDMIQGIFSQESEAKLIDATGREFSSFVITVTLSLVALIEEYQDEMEWKIDDSIKPQESLLDIEKSLKGAIEASSLCNEETFEYALGDKARCNLCQKEYKGLKRHLNSCIDKTFEKGRENLYYLIIESDPKRYYLHISIRANATLADLDAYIREVWVECCGHMSDFYLRGDRGRIDITTSIKKAFSSSKKLGYIYDYGTSTYLSVEFVKSFKGKQEHIIKTLARNSYLKVICEQCKKREAVAVCSQCMWNEDEAYLCHSCMPEHKCDMEMFLPYVNSPRVGECGYGSWADVVGLSQEEMKQLAEEIEW